MFHSVQNSNQSPNGLTKLLFSRRVERDDVHLDAGVGQLVGGDYAF